jgi:chromosome segregation ATPase
VVEVNILKQELQKERKEGQMLVEKMIHLETEKEELDRNEKQIKLENSELKLRIEVLEGQLEEKIHLETLFVQVREELNRNRETMKQDRDRAKQDLLDREEEIGKMKVILRESKNENEQLQEKTEELTKKISKLEMVWNEEIQDKRKRQNREVMLVKENQAQQEKLEECQKEVRD